MTHATGRAELVHDIGHDDSGAPASQYVLVVDDEAAVRDYLKRCLEGSGYLVKVAAGAAEALELMMTAPASVVLCDVRMPGQDGLWLAERLHAHWPRTAVVMATAIDDLQTVNQSRELGAVDYISKPIRPDQLIEAVRRAQASTQGSGPSPIENDKTLGEDFKRTPNNIEAEYALETPVRCPACGERITTMKAVRLIRAQVNFTSTLPRRGRVMACPCCLAVIPAELTNF
jgi:CheY-like chemotaxis protein